MRFVVMLTVIAMAFVAVSTMAPTAEAASYSPCEFCKVWPSASLPCGLSVGRLMQCAVCCCCAVLCCAVLCCCAVRSVLYVL
jgi:hypothetical protein